MKKSIILFFITFSTAFLNAQVEFESTLVSRYIWRGMDLFPENNPAIQPQISTDFASSKLSVSLWGSFALDNRSNLKTIDETDLIIDYNFLESEMTSLSAGMNTYIYPFVRGFTFKKNSTAELYITAEFFDIPFQPLLSCYYDFNLGKGYYMELSGNKEFFIRDKKSVIVSAETGYNSGQYITSSGLTQRRRHASRKNVGSVLRRPVSHENSTASKYGAMVVSCQMVGTSSEQTDMSPRRIPPFCNAKSASTAPGKGRSHSLPTSKRAFRPELIRVSETGMLN
jgi:hypothetical protein